MLCLISVSVTYCSFYVRQNMLSKLIIKSLVIEEIHQKYSIMHQNLDGHSSEKTISLNMNLQKELFLSKEGQIPNVELEHN